MKQKTLFSYFSSKVVEQTTITQDDIIATTVIAITATTANLFVNSLYNLKLFIFFDMITNDGVYEIPKIKKRKFKIIF
jgi:hypothetical protein